jgi:hypothetical protein
MPALTTVRDLCATHNQDGRIELFALGADGAMWHRWQTAPNGPFADWQSLGGNVSQPFAVPNQDGRIELFAIGATTDRAVWHRWQTAANGPFADWHSMGGDVSQPCAIRNHDGRLELFATGTDGAVWHRWQTAPNGPFADWHSLGGNVSRPFAIHNQDGRLELFAIGATTDRAVWHRWQTAPNGPFADWHSLGGDVREVTAIHNQDGRIELFAVGGDGALSHRWQTAPNGPFADWHSLGGNVSQPFAIQNQDGRIELFAVGTDRAVWHRWQTAPNGPFADWHSLGGDVTRPFAVRNQDGRIELFAIGTDGAVWHRWQTAPNGPFAEWAQLAQTPRFVFSAPIVTGGLAALGGSVTVTVHRDGSVRWQGHAHNSGLDGYDFAVSAIVRAPSGKGVALVHRGSVGGTLTSGSRDHDWDETQPPSAAIAASFDSFAGAQLETNLEYSSDIGSAFEAATGWLVKYGVGTVLGPVGGAVVFVGVEVGSLVATGSLVPGARIVGDLLWMAGPANTLYAILAEGIAALGSRTRELTQEEYDWANAEVFRGALPPRDRLVLTDTIAGDRAFVFPRFDGKITINMGAESFDDPRGHKVNGTRRRYPGQKIRTGEVFVHELVHTCQIQHADTDLSLLADAIASKVCEATGGGSPYSYGPAGFDYAPLNLEQQAQIVSDWFAGAVPDGSNQTRTAKDESSPYFRYITDNLRIGRF